jgi:uncharacterized membrane protein YkvA (DUF1232 family)
MWKRLGALWALVRTDARLLARAWRHPASPAWLKVGVAGLAIYVLSPVDLVPDWVPVIGLLDDVVLVPIAVRFLLDRLPAALQRDIGRQPG